MPDSPETRLGRLEQAQARLEQRVHDLAADIEGLVPLSVGVARLEGRIELLTNDVAAVTRSLEGVKTGIAERERAVSDERRSLRVALIGLSAIIIAAIIAGVATVIAAGIA